MTLPANMEAEQLAIGTALRYPETIDDFMKLKEDDFVSERNRIIYRAIKESYREEEHVEIASVANKIKGVSLHTILEYSNLAYSPTAMQHIMEQLQEQTKRRTLLKAAQMIQDRVSSPAEDVDELLNKTAEFIEVASSTQDKEPRLLVEVVEENINNYLSGEREKGIQTDLYELDKIWDGMLAPEATVIAGRPSMGKSLVASYFAIKAAKKTQKPVCFFSLEMADNHLADRYIATAMRVDLQSWRRGYVSREQVEHKAQSVINAVSTPVYLHDEAGLTTFDIQAISRKVQRKEGLSLIVVDYLTLLKDEAEVSGRNDLRVGDLAKKMREVGKKLKVPVLVVAQLNRDVEKREDKRPKLSDLDESGKIEQHIDNAIFLYREEYYYPKTTERKGTMDIILAKQRQGPRWLIAEVGYNASTGELYNLERRRRE